jgi:large repetitive protein
MVTASVALLAVPALASASTSASAGHSAALSVTATRAASGTAISVSTSTPYPGEAVTVTATVSSHSRLVPTGAVTFTDASGTLCTRKLSGGKMHCTFTPKAAGGRYTVTGRYGGDAAHAGSSGKSAAITVTKVPTTTKITSIASDRVPAGKSAIVTVVVTSNRAGAPAATGTVRVVPSNPALARLKGYSCTLTLTSASHGRGTCRVTPPVPTFGDIRYDATYNGDRAHSASAYTGGYLVVVPDTTTTAITFSPAAGTVGEPETIRATVTNQARDNISPTAGGTGTVTFSIGGTPIAGCSDVRLTYSKATGNTATCSYSPTAAGSVTVTGAYSGDEANLASSGRAALSAS